jgi:hypothetical protein
MIGWLAERVFDIEHAAHWLLLITHTKSTTSMI